MPNRDVSRRRLRGRPLLLVGVTGLASILAACSAPNAVEPQATKTSSTSGPQSSTPPSSATSSTTVASTAPAPAALPAGRPLSGTVVGIDPGHNGLNHTNPAYLSQQIFNGRTQENCDTTGTQTASGYTEAQFNFNVAEYLVEDLQSEGAQVVLTRSNNSGLGPCVDQRSQIINSAHADVAIDIHADGGPADGRGFAILEPVADGPNDGVISSSQTFGNDVRTAFLTTGMPISTYDGTNGIAYRDDLAGLNLTTVPKVLIECGNMQNATDAALLTTSSFQQAAALALAQAITHYLAQTGKP